MSSKSIKQRYLEAMQETYRMTVLHGSRSTERTKVLHGWVQEELRQELREDYTLIGQSRTSKKEAKVAVCIMKRK